MLRKVIDVANKLSIPVILDNKRGDIGTTSAAYATATFQRSGASCCTISPYLGYDGVWNL